MKRAVEAQLDPDITPKGRTRRLESLVTKILYWQRRTAKAAYYHDRRRRRDLRAAGVDLRKALRCPTRI
ncbi:MAG: hypothetical protein IH787_08495 [Nitrospirae bacterium]|nr:hypothetical protein [Nitrospirota bacterium]